MKRVIAAIAISTALTVSLAAPAQAARDGETGYAIGCLISWHVLGNWNVCQELQN